jgi:hypothetical protein
MNLNFRLNKDMINNNMWIIGLIMKKLFSFTLLFSLFAFAQNEQLAGYYTIEAILKS